jgi:hypothetical protein
MSGSRLHLSQGSVQDIATGMLLMSVFTLLWTLVAQTGLHHRDHAVTGILFSLISTFFIGYSLYLYALARRYPVWAAAENRILREKRRRWYRIIFGSELLAIGLASWLLVSSHRTDILFPVLALIVGLYFYPMSRIFRQTIDYYLGTWISLVALTGLYLTLHRLLPSDDVSVIVGTGVAIATSIYGFIIFIIGIKLPKH